MALFVGRIPRSMSNRDLEDTFAKFGKITRLDVKKGFGFVEFEDKRDGEDALKSINGKGELVVEWAKNGGKRPGENECFFCGKEGHWARDCPDNSRGDRGGGRRFGRDRSPRRGGDGGGRDRRYTVFYIRNNKSCYACVCREGSGIRKFFIFLCYCLFAIYTG
ncbi:hypothetical protein K501DRAFT_31021 [Backusella circina FSU 941]|nr:hypothetical protein K501DRAFT_31021 [Backusella circina FSU 941]